MGKLSIRLAWYGLFLIVIAGVALLLAKHRRSDRSPLAASGKAAAISERPRSESVLSPGSADKTAGREAQYELKGNLDVRFLLGLGDQKTGMRVSLKNIEATFGLRTLGHVGPSLLLAVVPYRFKGEVGAEGQEGGLTSRFIDVADFHEKAASFSQSVLFLMSKQGVLEEVLVDERHDSTSWLRTGYPDYIDTVLSLILLFPPLPAQRGLDHEYVGEIRILNVINFEDVFIARRAELGTFLVEGYPRKIAGFVGTTLTQPVEIPKAASSFASVSGLFDQRGYFRKVTHSVDVGTETTFTRVSLSIDLISVSDDLAITLDGSNFERMKRFRSIDELSKVVVQLKRKVPQLKEAEHVGETELAGMLTRLDSILARGGRDNAPEADTLQDEIANALSSNPDLLKGLASLLGTIRFSEGMLVEIVTILSSSRVRNVRGSDELATGIVGHIRGEEALSSALLCLRNYSSDRVIEFLTTYTPENNAADAMRNSALQVILQNVAGQQDERQATRILNSFYARIQSAGSFDAGLYGVFRYKSPVIDKFVNERWSSDVDKTSALKLMALRAYADTERSKDFRTTFESNVFTYFSESRLLGDIVPLAASTQNRTLLELLVERAPAASVRTAAEAVLARMRLFEGKK